MQSLSFCFAEPASANKDWLPSGKAQSNQHDYLGLFLDWRLCMLKSYQILKASSGLKDFSC